MKYYLPNHEDNIIALLEHPDRIHHIDGEIMEGTQWGKVVAAMQEPFPVLIDLELSGFTDVPALTGLTSRFLGGSAPRLQEFALYSFPFPIFQRSFHPLVASFFSTSTIFHQAPRVAFHQKQWLRV